jgi:hypothetical protein
MVFGVAVAVAGESGVNIVAAVAIAIIMTYVV